MFANSPVVPVVSRQALSAVFGASETRRKPAVTGFQEAVKGPGWTPALQSCKGEGIMDVQANVLVMSQVTQVSATPMHLQLGC